MAKVAHQAVGNINRRMRERGSSQRQAQGHARRRQVHALGGGGKLGSAQCILIPVACQRQAGVAEGAGNPDVVARLRRIAPQRVTRRYLAEHRDADVQRALGGIAPDQFTAMRVGERKQTV